MRIMTSAGIKRQIAAVLAIILEVLRAIPGGNELVLALEGVAATVGLAGLGHAAAQNTLLARKRLAGLASLCMIMATVLKFFPDYAGFVMPLEQAAALFGAASLGALVQNSDGK